MTMIMNEFDMFNVLLEKAAKKETDKEQAKDFYEGMKQLPSVLSFVKMRKTPEGFEFERGFDIVGVSVMEDNDNTVTLKYIKGEYVFP